jgi:hypothetical protein
MIIPTTSSNSVESRQDRLLLGQLSAAGSIGKLGGGREAALRKPRSESTTDGAAVLSYARGEPGRARESDADWNAH